MHKQKNAHPWSQFLMETSIGNNESKAEYKSCYWRTYV